MNKGQILHLWDALGRLGDLTVILEMRQSVVCTFHKQLASKPDDLKMSCLTVISCDLIVVPIFFHYGITCNYGV